MGKKGTIHFTIGEEIGIRLMEIAQEHLIYNHNPIKAVETITKSLIGCPTEYALKILKGDIVLPVDVESQQVIATERIPEIHDNIFPKLNLVKFITDTELDIRRHSMLLNSSWLQLQNKIINSRTFTVDFEFDEIFKFIAGNDEIILDKLRDDEDLNAIALLLSTTKNFIEHIIKVQNVINWIFYTWKSEIDILDFNEIKSSITNSLSDISETMNDVLTGNFDLEVNNELQSYLNCSREITQTIEAGIKPVDIFDNYSAGWLSPEGVFYGLNGEIANMLHTQIADALQEIGVIPMYKSEKEEELKMEVNPDSWLEQQGWVKIHGNNINYAGCLNKEISLENVNMTNVQVDIIKRYINLCHGGIMRCGWKMTKISAARFEIESSNPIMLNKNYFLF